MIVGNLLAATFWVASLSGADMTDEAMAPHLEVMDIWQTHVHPEAVYAPEAGGFAYISDMDRLEEGEAERPLHHAIHRINLETGEIAFNWAEAGVEQPLGITSFEGILYVVEGENSIALYDMESGARVNRYRLDSDDPSFFNDVAVTPEGRIFVGDMRQRALYALETSGEYSLIAQGDVLRGINGLDWYKGEVLTVTSPENGKILSINSETGAIREIAEMAGERFDGIYQDGRGGVFISSIPGKIFHMTANEELRLVDDFASPETSANSIGGYGMGNYLLVPHFTAGQVSRYEISYRE